MLERLPEIPSVLDEETKLVYWSVSELFLCFFVALMVGIFCSFWFAPVLGVLALQTYRRLKQSSYGDLTKAGRYWMFPSDSAYQYLVPSHIRRLLG